MNDRLLDQTPNTDAQISLNDTDWTDAERDQMKSHGYDDMDMLRAWFE